EIPLTPPRVYLVGAGPGDPSLLTLRAAELLRTADVVILDPFVSPEIVSRIGSHARIIEARTGRKTLSQDEINRRLIEEGKKGRVVVRLKGGDPFLFGRGAEEAEALRAAGIPFEVVPGIPPAIAAPAYAGIPVMHPAHTTTVTFIAGNEDGAVPIPWRALAGLDGTLVFLGVSIEKLTSISGRLMDQGADPSLPAAVISQGTTRTQKTVDGTLETIAEHASRARLEPPALFVVGRVAALRDTIGWFESKPLFGRTVVVTRARGQASPFVRILEAEGATVAHFPMIEIAPPDSWESLDLLIEELPSFSWLVFTSTNGVDHFFERLQHHGRDLRALTGTKIAAVGETTAASLHSRGIIPDIVPEKFQASALLPLFDERLDGVRIGIVRAATGREELVTELRARGADVHLAIAYETRPTRGLSDQLGSLLGSGRLDAITFTSSSTVDNFFEQLRDEEKRKVIDSVRLASIGPVTSASLRAHGAEPAIEAPEATIHALTQALVEHFRKETR
ncbi:MAG TPA: uroporphyrinogen-III C-methyltransferase, partial [Thermoanaerobaculia bacterium]|nr:uroporphyrinogen-III C-methyltransferase [Thermoanaerobaculia bacterium]